MQKRSTWHYEGSRDAGFVGWRIGGDEGILVAAQLLKNTTGAYSYTCPDWRNQSTAIKRRTFIHVSTESTPTPYPGYIPDREA